LDPSAIVEWLNTLPLSTSYKKFILENQFSGAVLTTISTRNMWQEFPFKLGDRILISGEMQKILGF